MAVLQFLIFVMVLLVSDTSAGYVYSKHQVNWKTAKYSCESSGGALLGQTPILGDFVDKLPVWLDGVTTWSPWMANAGCYRYVEQNIEIRSFYTLKYNNPLLCLRRCKYQLPIGLLNETCYCLTTFPKLKKVSGSFCQKTCPGSKIEPCGGSGKLGFHEYINIYNHEPRTLDIGNNSCLTVEVREGVFKYRDRKCTAMFPVLCQDSRRHLIERMEQKHWQDAVTECTTYNLELADFQTIEKNVFMTNREFWTGYFRKPYAVWKPDVDIQSVAGCYILDNTGYKIENCSKIHNYICFKEDTSSSTPKTPRTSSVAAVTILAIHSHDKDTCDCAVLVAVTVVCVIVFILVVVGIVIIIYRRRRLKRKRGNIMKTATNTQELREKYNQLDGVNARLLNIEKEHHETQPEISRTSNDGSSVNTDLVQSTVNIADEAYNHLQLNGQTVSFSVDGVNIIHNVTGSDSFHPGFSHVNGTQDEQSIHDYDTYSHSNYIS